MARWALTLWVGVLGQEDFTSQNQGAISAIRTDFNTYQQDAKTAQSNVYNNWKSAFDSAVSTIKGRLDEIKNAHTGADQSFRSQLNTNDPLKNTDRVINTAALASQKHSQKSTKELSKIEAAFEKTATRNLDSYLKQAVSQTDGFQNAVGARRKQIDARVKQTNVDIGSQGRRLTKDLNTWGKKTDDTRSKYEDKFEATSSKLEDLVEHGDEMLTDMEGRVENAEADTTNVVESEDPGSPGMEFKLKEADESVTEAMENAQEELESMSTTNADDMKYGEEDITTGFADTAAELGDMGRIYLEHIGKSGASLRRSLDKANTANNDAHKALATNVQNEFTRAEAVSVQLEELGNKVDHVKDVMHTQLEAMVEKAVEQLEQGFEQQFAAFESQQGSVFQYVESDKEQQDLKAQTHIEQVKQAFISEVQQAASQSASLASQAEAALNQAQVTLGLAEDKISKVQTEMAQQEIKKQLIPASLNQVQGAVNHLTTTMDATETVVNAQYKQHVAAGQEAAFQATKIMGDAYASTINDINVKTQLEGSRIQDTAGMAAEKLNTMVQDKVDQFGYLKKDVEVADTALGSAEEMLRKSYELLQAVPDTFSNIGARISEQLRDVAYEAETWAKDQEPLMKKGIEFAKTKTSRRYDRMEEEVEDAEERSTKNVDLQSDELTKMLQGALGDQDARRQELLAHRNGLDEDVNSKYENMQSMANRWGAALGSDKDGHTETSDKFNAKLQEQKKMFGDIATDTSTTGAAVIAQFQQSIGEALGEFSNSVLLTQKNADVAVLEAKKAIREATNADTLAFQAATAKLAAKLKDTLVEQAKLKKQTLSSQGGDEQAVADESLAEVDAAERAVQALLEKMQTGIGRIAQKANDRMQAAVTEHDSDRSDLKLMLNQQLSALSNEQTKSQRLFKERITKTDDNFKASARQMSGSMLDMERAMAEEGHSASELAAETSQAIGSEEHRIASQMRDDMVTEQAWQQGHGAEAEREAMQSKQVAVMAERTGAGVDKEVERAETAAHDHIEHLKPSSKEAALKMEVEQLAKMFESTMHSTELLQDQAETAASHLSENFEGGITAGQLKLAALGHNIDKAAEERDNMFQELDDAQNSSHIDIRSALSQLVELGIDMKIAMNNKALDVQKNIKDAEDAVGNVSQMASYADGSELERIQAALEVGTAQTQDLWAMVEDEVNPKTREQRKRVGQVFEDSGAALDMDRVEEMANETVTEELSARQRLNQARQDIEQALDAAAKNTSMMLNGVFEKTKHLIDSVEKMEHLSEREKAQKVSAIKAAAARETGKIMASARAEIEREKKAGQEMDDKNQEVGVLIGRAQGLAEGGFQTTGKDYIKKQLAETKNGLEALTDKWVNPFAASFLQETAATQKHQIQQGFLQEASEWTPAGELGTDLREAQSLSLRRADEDARLEKTLQQLRAVGS